MDYWQKRERVNKLHELKFDLCGHCDEWMKCTCPREKTGRKPSCAEWGCNQFRRDSFTQDLIIRYEHDVGG